MDFIEPCFGIGHNLSLICQTTSEDIKHQPIIILTYGASTHHHHLQQYLCLSWFMWWACSDGVNKIPKHERFKRVLILTGQHKTRTTFQGKPLFIQATDRQANDDKMKTVGLSCFRVLVLECVEQFCRLTQNMLLKMQQGVLSNTAFYLLIIFQRGRPPLIILDFQLWCLWTLEPFLKVVETFLRDGVEHKSAFPNA